MSAKPGGRLAAARPDAPRALALALAGALCVACGFQLRSAAPTATFAQSPATLRLVAAEDADELAAALSRELARRGPWRQRAGRLAACELRIERYRQARRPLAVAYAVDSPRDSFARVAGFQLSGEARASLRAAGADAPAGAWTVQSVRDYTFPADIDRPLARGAEEALLWGELRAEIARGILDRIAGFAASCAPDAAGRARANAPSAAAWNPAGALR